MQSTCSKTYGRLSTKGTLQLVYHGGVSCADEVLIRAFKIVSVCVSLGEYPAIRFFNPQNPTHEAAVLCAHLARFVQVELDQYAKNHEDFPPTSSRPRGTLIITDRSMDLYAPLIHEFTYQAMIHDLLPIIEGDKILYRSPPNPSEPTTETKMAEISEKDSIWVANRHLHMKDLIGKLVGDFEKFRAKNPQFGDRSVFDYSDVKLLVILMRCASAMNSQITLIPSKIC